MKITKEQYHMLRGLVSRCQEMLREIEYLTNLAMNTIGLERDNSKRYDVEDIYYLQEDNFLEKLDKNLERAEIKVE